MPAQTRGFLFSDLRGYSAFTEKHGDRAARELLAAYRLIVREAIASAGGAEIRTEGDSFYVVFSSVSQAVEAGLAIQGRLAQAGTSGQAIAAGIGIHAGEVEDDAEQGIVSSAVNIAARLCSAAQPGEVLVSDTVRALTRTYLDVTFVSGGRRKLKGIRDPIEVFGVFGQAQFRPKRRWAAARRRLPSAPALGFAIVVIAASAVLGGTLLREGLAGDTPTSREPNASASADTTDGPAATADVITTIVVPSLDPESGIAQVPLEVGRHQFERLRPKVTFDVPAEGWEAYRDYPDGAGIILYSGTGTEIGGVDFGHAQVVFAEPCLDSPTVLLGDSPNALIEWLQAHQHLDASDPVPVNLGGRIGVQIDVTPSGVDPCAVDGELPATYLFPLGEDAYRVLDGERLRVMRLDVGGTPFLILAWASEVQFDNFLDQASELINTIRLDADQ